MRSFLILLCVIFAISGCGKKPQPKEVTVTETEAVFPEEGVAVEEVVVEETVPGKGTVVMGEEQVFVQQGVIPETAKTPVIPAEPVPTLGAERLMKENRWGFSIFDPSTGAVKYYTSKGDYIGSAKR